jgi:asparagine synthase (glutamine-hydrolysing)
MCGIAGFVDFSRRPPEHWANALERMHDAIRHRGPDGSGRHVVSATTATVGLAHARLAIIDLSQGGHQPMAAADRTGWLTYNGEIYNYAALRDALVARGTPLRSTSDTEALVEWLALEGPAALNRLRGMFAFAWWDERAQRLLLARDRLGIKPLVYAQPEPGVLLFASEPRALIASGLFGRSPRPECVAEFLLRGSVASGAGFWRDLESVAAGEYVEVDAHGLRRREYWSLERTLLQPVPEAPVASVAAAAQRAIVGSVAAHLVSDVPVAIFLSGGIDSTALLAAAREVTTGPIQTFTVSMPGQRIDESEAARAIAKRFGSEHREVSLDTLDLDAAIDEFFAAMQSPSVDGFNTFLVARAARNAGVKVALSGVGGDELFGGYDSFTGVPRVAALQASLGPLRAAAAFGLRALPSSRAAKLGAILAAAPRTTAQVWWEYRRLFDDADVTALTGGSAGAAAPPAAPPGASDFAVIRWLEMRQFLVPQLLADSDAFAMCRGLEIRTPLVDHVVVDEIVQAGLWRHTAGESFKQSLFRAMPALTESGSLDRPKQGFVLPYATWLRAALTDSSPRQLRDFAERLRQPRYAPFVARFLSGRLHWSRLWAIYVLDRVTA